MHAEPVFPHVSGAAGMYESFYLRAVSPREPLGVWIRHTVHKPPGGPPAGSVWCTVFDARAGTPFMHKTTSTLLAVPAGGWIEVGGRAVMGPDRAEGECGPARWSLNFSARAAELRHLRPGLLYRTPVPRTKLTSPAPLAAFDGVLELEGREPVVLSGWPGMIGHNWGAEHAERWIWLHGCAFTGAGDAWLDVALGRVRVGSRMTPWIANGALGFDGATHTVGGIASARPRVRESPAGAELELYGRGGLAIRATVGVPPGTAAGWRYADPDGSSPQGGTSHGGGRASEHDVVNCSIAALHLDVSHRGQGGRRILRAPHGGTYELGMRERDHGVPLAPFGDG